MFRHTDRSLPGRAKLVSFFISILFLTLVGVTLFAPSSAHAADCGGVQTSIITGDICQGADIKSNDSADNPIISVLIFVMQLMTGAVGIAAIGALIYAGILYSAAGGEAGQVQKAKTIIKDTVIGVVVYGFMIIILNFVIPGGVFGQNSTVGSGTTGGSSSSGGSGAEENVVTFTAATYNIKCSKDCGGADFAWTSARANSILDYIKSVDVVGIQEGRDDSIPWLTSRLNTAGYGKSDNQWARQVFWKKSTFTLVKQGIKELDAEKDLVWVKLKEKTSGKMIYFATVHLDVSSTSNRLNEAKKAVKYMNSVMTDAPIVFVGDMNSARGSEQDKAIQAGGFKDAYDVATTKKNITYDTTLSNYNGGTSGKVVTSSKHQIDHIYIKGNLTVSRVEITTNRGSDHVPVEADIGIPVAASKASTSSSSSASTSLSGVDNFRDVAMLNSSVIKPGLFYRSAKLENASSADRTKLATLLKNGAIIDLRTPSVRTKYPDASVSGVPNVNYPIEGVADAEGYVRAFVTSSDGRKSLRDALTKIATTPGATLVHCTAGKDRTGWTVAMVMYILGASDDQVMTEYLKSKEAGANFKVDATWLNAGLDAATKHGKRSILDYIKSSSDGIGLSDSVITAMKAKLGVKS